MKTYDKLLRVVATLISACFLFATNAQETVTDSQGVIYDIVSQANHTVKISAKNSSNAGSLPENIVIPLEVMNTNTTTTDRGPYTVVDMADAAFKGVAKIKTLVIEPELTGLPRQAFQNCTGLTSITFPNSVTQLGNDVFSGCPALISVGNLTNVTSIGSGAFWTCSSLESISLPDGLTFLGASAFENCTSLQSVDLPAGVESIQSKCFMGCTSMQSITLHEGLKTIASKAFLGDTNLVAPSFPESLTLIDSNAFESCSNLGKLVMAKNAKIGSYVFQNSGITEIVWPENAVGFGSSNFYKVTKLTEVTIPGWLTSVPSSTFSFCSNLKKVTISEGVETLQGSCFSSCDSLTTVILPQSLDAILGSCFYQCKQLTGVKFPSRMKTLSRYAFHSCLALGDITLPADASMDTETFYMAGLTSITWPEEPMGWIGSNPFGSLQRYVKTLKIPSWMETVPDYLCYQWTSLQEVEFEDGPKYINRYAFYSCGELTKMTLPSTLVTIGEMAFYSNSKMGNVTLNEGITAIGASAFRSCKAMTEITLPSTLATIGSMAFYDCDGLTQVTCRDGLNFLGDSMFGSCDALEYVSLGATMERVERQAFMQCPKLVCPTFPATLEYIGQQAFYGNSPNFGVVTFNPGMTVGDGAFERTGVSGINFPETECYFGSRVFATNSIMEEIEFPLWMNEIPTGFCAAWSNLRHVDFGPQVTTIGNTAFQDCAKLHNVVLPQSLTKIGAQAFMSCGKLADCSITHEHEIDTSAKFGPVDFYKDVEIGDEAFRGTPISEIIFHDCATFKNNCFYQVQTIKKIQFPECMDTIPAGFCNGWNRLEYVMLPASLVNIGDKAFDGANSIKSIFVADDDYFTEYKAAHEAWENTDEAERGDEPQLPVGVFNFNSNNLQRIGESAFNNTPINRIDWPDHHISVGKRAFQMTQIKDLTIPAWMDTVPDFCFANCTKLASITWDSRAGDESAEPLILGQQSFASCTSLTKVDMPSFPTKWGNNGFAGCNHLTELNFSDAPLEIGDGMWSGCSALTRVVWPATVDRIPENTFNNCTALEFVDLRAGAKEIGKRAFYNAFTTAQDVKVEILFPETFGGIACEAFLSSHVQELHFPVGTYFLPNPDGGVFKSCKQLTTITFEDGPVFIPAESFKWCSALTTFKAPSTLESIGVSCFSECTALKNVELNEGLKTIENFGFFKCSALEHIVIPSTLVNLNTQAFKDCSSLQTVVSHGEGLTIDSNCFDNDVKLASFTADGSIKVIGNSAFNGCVELADFTYTGSGNITKIDGSAFKNCHALKAFPYLRRAEVKSNAFENCYSLTQIELPETGKFFERSETLYRNSYLKNCTSLQSIVSPYTGPEFALNAKDVAGAPLEGLSFAFNRNIVHPKDATDVGTTSSIEPYNPENPDKLPMATPKTSKLIVMRGEKWKFEEQGYGQLFDIEELKEPQIHIEGFIHSEFNPESNTNHYRACLRWDIPLSDLNMEGQTIVDIKRDGKVIGSVVFEQPYETEEQSEIPAGADFNRAIIVNYSVNDMDNSFHGDFYFPETQADGSVKYQYEYAHEDNRMVFNAYTHKRYGTFNKYGYNSYFTMFDEFDSRNLSEKGVELQYTYSAVLRKYPYGIPVNNDNFEIINGKRYHYEDAPLVDCESNEVVMRVAMAVPQLNAQGLYTFDEIKDDRAVSLNTADVFNPNNLQLDYSFDPSMVGLQYYEEGSLANKDIFTIIEAKEVAENGTTRDVGSVDLVRNGHSPIGNVVMNNGERLVVGRSYQTVVNSGPLGSTGSPVITIPGVPTIEPEAILGEVTCHSAGDFGGHDDLGYHVEIRFNPDCEAMGVSQFGEDVEYYVGLRRGVGSVASHERGWYDLHARAASASELIHHVEGPQQQSPACNDCHSEAGGLAAHDEYGLVYNDVAFFPKSSTAEVNYDMALYVRVPDDMLRTAEPRYMAVSSSASDSKMTLSGVEDVSLDNSDADSSAVRYFDLQGRPLAAPIPGHPCLELTPSGSRVVVP